jgi:hypothetical protein
MDSTETRYSRADVENLLDIKKDTYYKWIKYLEIETQKDSEGKAYITESDLERLSDLKDYYQENGKIDGFLLVAEKGELATVEANGLSKQNDFEIPDNEAEFDLEDLIREAAEIKAQNLVMPELVKLHLAGQLTFEDLPPDLQQKVKAVQEATRPKNPSDIAGNLLNKWRSKKRGNVA